LQFPLWLSGLVAHSVCEDAGSIPGLNHWVKDPVLLWLCCNAQLAALIQPLSWKLPYGTGVAIKKKKEDGSSHCGLVVTNLTSVHAGSIPGLAQWVNHLALP